MESSTSVNHYIKDQLNNLKNPEKFTQDLYKKGR